MRTKIFAYSHMITYAKLPTIAYVRTLFYIHRLTAFGEQVLSTSIAQLVPYPAQ